MELIVSDNESEQEEVQQPELIEVPSFVTPQPIARYVSYQLQ